jgi:hypothetical protein
MVMLCPTQIKDRHDGNILMKRDGRCAVGISLGFDGLKFLIAARDCKDAGRRV